MSIQVPDSATTRRWIKAARITWVLLAIGAGLMLIASLPGYLIRFGGQLTHVPADQISTSDRVFAVLGGIASLASAMLSIGLAWLIFRKRFDKPLPIALSIYLLIYSIVMAGPLEHWGEYWLGTTQFSVALQGTMLGIPTVALLALFPDGRFVPSWTRWFFYAAIPWGLSFLFAPELTPSNFARYPWLLSINTAGFVITMIVGLYGQLHRYRKVSTTDQRQQTKWVVFGFGLWITYMLFSSIPYFYLSSLSADQQAPWWTGMSELGWWLSLNIMPIALTIATLRYRLWNIDRVINRTLVYTSLTAIILAIYGLLVGGMSVVFQTGGNPWMPLLATGMAAVLFQPLRARMQGLVNRIMYGDRDDPAAVLTKLGEQLEQTGTPEQSLNAIVQTISQALKLPYVAIEWGDDGETVASYGIPAVDTEILPLTHQGHQVGHLRVAPRSRGEPLSTKDNQLLKNVARQAGTVVHSARLTADLVRVRERLVSSREEERRRIRRDLHDGLGPKLAALALKLDAARNLLERDHAAVNMLLIELKQGSQDAITEIRSLVYNLRPPALDDLGLLQALREHAASITSPQKLAVDIKGPDMIPQLPAAVEVAAYRIVLEALNNALKHSGASKFNVDFRMGDGLTIEISDNGCGIPDDYRAGIGITSMRERVVELGGEFSLASAQGSGTVIISRFPSSSLEAP